MLDGGKSLQLYLYRDHSDIDAFIRAAEAKNVLGKQHAKLETEPGVLRLTINDQKFMINTVGKTIIDIKELNFNPKDFSIIDFDKGKVAILIDFTLEGETDNSKFKKEIKDYFMEENDARDSETNTD